MLHGISFGLTATHRPRHAIGGRYAREGEPPDTCFLKPVMHCVIALSDIELAGPSSREP
jgi:hypothetical protein